MTLFQRAIKLAQPAHIALAGPAGSGKTYTALALAHAFGGSVAVVDTNRKSASLYVGLNGWEFDTVAPTTFSPQSLIDLLLDAGAAGYDNIIIDSWSAYWSGLEGMLEQVDQRARGQNQNQGWREVRPVERAMMDALLTYPGNVIVTLRVKTEAIVERERVGEFELTTVRRVGLKPEQRDGLEYEFDLYCDIDSDHTLTVSKSRIPKLSSTTHKKPGKQLAARIAEFLNDGDVIPTATDLRHAAMEAEHQEDIVAIGQTAERHGLLAAVVQGADGQANALDNVLRGRHQTLPPRPAEASDAVDEAPDPDPQQPPEGDGWVQPDVPTPSYITGEPEEGTDA